MQDNQVDQGRQYRRSQLELSIYIAGCLMGMGLVFGKQGEDDFTAFEIIFYVLLIFTSWFGVGYILGRWKR